MNYVPCSGLTGDNLMTTPSLPELTSWYSGPTLLQRIGETAAHYNMRCVITPPHTHVVQTSSVLPHVQWTSPSGAVLLTYLKVMG